MKQTPILFENIFDSLNTLIEIQKEETIFILVDENTHKHCLSLLLSEIKTSRVVEIIEIPAGEENKSLEITQQVWATMSELGGNRNGLLINLGGGMVTDLGGFIASTFKRGIKYINIPTSLLAIVDASVGGKTGIDLNGVKNLIGTFSMPELTLIYPSFLKTLPQRELKSGLAEMFKHGLIQSYSHWDNLIHLNNYNSESILDLIQESIHIKLKIIETDPYETGLRKSLNFGHTIGHAIESEYLTSENPFLHGEAVVIGMLVESILSYENELITKVELDTIFSNLVKVFGQFEIPSDKIPNLLNWMKFDKKNEHSKINFSLLNGIGNCQYNIFLSETQISEGILLYNQKLDSLT